MLLAMPRWPDGLRRTGSRHRAGRVVEIEDARYGRTTSMPSSSRVIRQILIDTRSRVALPWPYVLHPADS